MTGGVMLAATKERFEWIKGLVAKGRVPRDRGGDHRTRGGARADASPRSEVLRGRHADLRRRPYRPVRGSPTRTPAPPASSAPRSTVTPGWRRSAAPARASGGWSPTRARSHAEHVVNAAGLWAREVGRMVGLELPVLAMEHMYLITEDMPEVAAINESTGKEVIHVVDFDGELYLRQERGGMLMGTYEKGVRAVVDPRDAVGLRPRAPPRGHRPDRAFARGRFRALPGVPDRGHQADRERAVHVRAGRQPAHRPGPGPRRVLGRVRG